MYSTILLQAASLSQTEYIRIKGWQISVSSRPRCLKFIPFTVLILAFGNDYLFLRKSSCGRSELEVQYVHVFQFLSNIYIQDPVHCTIALGLAPFQPLGC